MKKLTTGVTTTHRKTKDKGLPVTRIDVYSQKYEEDTIYQDVTLDTAYSNHLKETLTKTFTR